MIASMPARGSQWIGRVPWSKAAAALLLLLFLGAAGRASDIPKRIPGRVTLSDGTTYEGTIRTTTGRPLVLVETGTGRRLPLHLGDIWRIRVRIAHEEQYRVWRWVEDGSRQKVYTGKSYPLRKYETEVVLRTGEVRRGALVAVLYVYPKGRPKAKPVRVILRREEKGEVGTDLKSLTYVESVEFPGAKPAAEDLKGTMIALTVTPPGSLVAADAIPRSREGATEGMRSKTPGLVTFPGLLPDVYDLVVVTHDHIYLSLAAGKDAGKPLSDKVLAAVQARVTEIPDFFEKRQVVAAVGEGNRVRALVFKTRTGKTSLRGGHTFRRWEVWTLEKPADRWLVRDRSYVFREHGEDLPPRREVVLVKGLAGVKVKTGTSKVRFAIPGKEDR